MRPLLLASLAVLTFARLGSAATLAITPTGACRIDELTVTVDRQVYQVGETITLHVFGDSEGAAVHDHVFGRIRFDPNLAGYVDSHQEPLTTNGSPWWLSQLTGGAGFADAFAQFEGEVDPVDGPLSATVRLLATAPGTLDYSWEKEDLTLRLVFFDLTTASGGSVEIVPALPTGALGTDGSLPSSSSDSSGASGPEH